MNKIFAILDCNRLKQAGLPYRHLSQYDMLDASQILRHIASVEQGDSALCVLVFSAFIST